MRTFLVRRTRVRSYGHVVLGRWYDEIGGWCAFRNNLGCSCEILVRLLNQLRTVLMDFSCAPYSNLIHSGACIIVRRRIALNLR